MTMKALLICPSPRPAVALLAERLPLAVIPLLGESLLEYWLVHLAGIGVKQVTVLAADRPDEVQRVAGDGARWGLQVAVGREETELAPAQARARYCTGPGWRWAPEDAVLMDHLPGLPGLGLFESYDKWFGAAQVWMDRAITPDRVGAREIQPGVRVGLHSRVPADAMLVPPCWIGERVFLGAGVRIGPHTIVEDRAMIESGAEITRSIIGPETLVGRSTEITDSLAWEETLINWRTGSCLRVPDDFLLCSLRRRHHRPEAAAWFQRLTGGWSRPPAAVPAAYAPPGNSAATTPS